ncbi:MAG: hypothetical protein IIB71_13060 [Proteobacteria bacterium]|nr:hypothetical protein [Pseudomonadota bacterium]
MLEIVLAERGRPPFPVELIAFEEDTYLVLSAGNFAREIRQETSELLAEMSQFGSLSLGTVVQKGQRLYAVVHDLDRHPSCDKRVVRKALLEIVRICNEGDIHSIAIEPLGCVHGKLESEWFLKQLWEVAATSSLRHIWVYD